MVLEDIENCGFARIVCADEDVHLGKGADELFFRSDAPVKLNRNAIDVHTHHLITVMAAKCVIFGMNVSLYSLVFPCSSSGPTICLVDCNRSKLTGQSLQDRIGNGKGAAVSVGLNTDFRHNPLDLRQGRAAQIS